MGNLNSRRIDAEYSEKEIQIEAAVGKKKMTKGIASAASGIIDDLDSTWILPDDLAFELLTRLPFKDLHQFKRVSKSWSSIIRNPVFSEAYRTRHPNGGLLISLLEGDNIDYLEVSFPPPAPAPAQIRFYYSALDEAEEQEPFFCRFRVPPPPDPHFCYEGVTQVVNGLACFFARNRAFVCNVCSGEIMRLPDSSSPEGTVQYNYYFGFDPVNKVYKLLKWTLIARLGSPGLAAEQLTTTGVSSWGKKFIMPMRNSPDYYKHCELLTLGRDSSWRKLEDDHTDNDPPSPAPLMFETQSFLVNGVLYWMDGRPGAEFDSYIISFDLNKEKFGMIGRPPVPERSKFSLNSHRFAQFNGRLAFLRLTFGEHRLFIDTFTNEKGASWTTYGIHWPTQLGSCSGMVSVGNLPTGEILLVNPKSINKVENSCTPIYSYDYQNNKFQRFDVGQFPLPLFYYWDKMALAVNVSCVVEKTEPLEVLFGQKM